jgi:hypothetical protein
MLSSYRQLPRFRAEFDGGGVRARFWNHRRVFPMGALF